MKKIRLITIKNKQRKKLFKKNRIMLNTIEIGYQISSEPYIIKDFFTRKDMEIFYPNK